MTILTSYTSATYKAQIRSSVENGFKQIYSGTSTESGQRAAKNLVAKWFGSAAAETVRMVKDKAEINALVGDFFDDPSRKQVFDVWTFDQSAKADPAKSPLVQKAEALRAAKPDAKDAAPEVTEEQPRRAEWDAVRETINQITFAGRMFVRGQVKLGMLLAGLKKAHQTNNGGGRGGDRQSMGRICPLIPWEKIVLQETGFSRRSGDEFIRLYEATKVKLKKAKTLKLPAGLSKDAIVLFQSENALALTDQQWTKVDELIGTLTTGETQASLMQEIGIIAKPKAMPKKIGGKDDEEEEPTAGQLAFHFFEAWVSPFINARTNPDFKKLLYALPVHSDSEHPISVASLKAEIRAMLADLEEAEQSNAKPAKGRTVEVSPT